MIPHFLPDYEFMEYAEMCLTTISLCWWNPSSYDCTLVGYLSSLFSLFFPKQRADYSMKCHPLHQVVTSLQHSQTSSADNRARGAHCPSTCVCWLQLKLLWISTVISVIIRFNAQHFSLIVSSCLFQLFLILCIFTMPN